MADQQKGADSLLYGDILQKIISTNHKLSSNQNEALHSRT